MAMTNELPAARTFLRRHFPAGGRVLCAVSGGLDSMCLLHFMNTWGRQNGFFVAAAHFNHHLRGAAADRDAQFVGQWCEAWKITCFTGDGDTRGLMARAGLSMEEAARTLRYDFLRRTARQEGFGAILTAHHADDNAETMLLNLIRGTGTAGLIGIPPVRGNIYRPFLRISRADLEGYARQHGIDHVEDETNQEDEATRNVLRHQVFPVLRELNSRAVENMSQAAGVLAREHAALESMAASLVCQAAKTPQGYAVPCRVLAQAPRAVAERAVLHLLAGAAGARKNLTAAHVEGVLALAGPGQERAQISLPRGLTARREGYTLYVERAKRPPAPVSIEPGTCVCFGAWQVRLTQQPVSASSLAVRLPAEASLTVSTWHREDRMTLPGGQSGRSVKRLCAERGISPVQRDALAVLRVDGIPAAAARLGVDAAFAAAEDEAALFITFQHQTEENDYEKRDGKGHPEGSGDRGGATAPGGGDGAEPL